MEQFVEYPSLTKEDLDEPITQLRIMNWEEENMIKPNIKSKRQLLDDEEWDEFVTKKKINERN